MEEPQTAKQSFPGVCLDDENDEAWENVASDRETESTSGGIYFLYRNHRLVYVGRSDDMPKRIAVHRMNGRPFDVATMMHVPSHQAAYVEAALIRALAPAQNKKLKAEVKKPLAEPKNIIAPIQLPPAFAPQLSDDDGLLSKKGLRQFILYSPAHIDRLEKAGKFPQRVRIGDGWRGRVGWRKRDIIEWIANKAHP